MTKRTDIIDASEVYLADGSIRKYGLIYTRQCGWVDLGHANPAGAKALWNDICRYTVSNACLRDPNAEVPVTYAQSMKKLGISAEESQTYLVKKQLTRDEQQAVPSLGKLPPSLNTIVPAVEGVKFRRAP